MAAEPDRLILEIFRDGGLVLTVRWNEILDRI